MVHTVHTNETNRGRGGEWRGGEGMGGVRKIGGRRGKSWRGEAGWDTMGCALFQCLNDVRGGGQEEAALTNPPPTREYIKK